MRSTRHPTEAGRSIPVHWHEVRWTVAIDEAPTEVAVRASRGTAKAKSASRSYAKLPRPPKMAVTTRKRIPQPSRSQRHRR